MGVAACNTTHKARVNQGGEGRGGTPQHGRLACVGVSGAVMEGVIERGRDRESDRLRDWLCDAPIEIVCVFDAAMVTDWDGEGVNEALGNCGEMHQKRE